MHCAPLERYSRQRGGYDRRQTWTHQFIGCITSKPTPSSAFHRSHPPRCGQCCNWCCIKCWCWDNQATMRPGCITSSHIAHFPARPSYHLPMYASHGIHHLEPRPHRSTNPASVDMSHRRSIHFPASCGARGLSTGARLSLVAQSLLPTNYATRPASCSF